MNTTKVALPDIRRVLAFIDGRSSGRAGSGAVPALSRVKRVGVAALDGVWQFLVAVGQVRARSEMLRLAAQYESTRPELAARLRAAARESWLA